METMTQLKDRAGKWPGEWGKTARELIQDAHLDLSLCQPRHITNVVEDLRRALTALENEMLEVLHLDEYGNTLKKRCSNCGGDVVPQRDVTRAMYGGYCPGCRRQYNIYSQT